MGAQALKCRMFIGKSRLIDDDRTNPNLVALVFGMAMRSGMLAVPVLLLTLCVSGCFGWEPFQSPPPEFVAWSKKEALNWRCKKLCWNVVALVHLKTIF